MESKPDIAGSSEESFQAEPLVRILIVEDNPGDVVILTHLLKSSGMPFNLTHVPTLKESLKICRDIDFDIILLDLGLPDSIGLETLKKIQAAEVKSPVVVMTGLDDEKTALASLREGALDYLVKNKLTTDNIIRSLKYSIERKKILDLQKKHIRQFSVLSASSAVLNEYEDITECYKIICENLNNLLGKATILAFEFINPSKWRISGADRFKQWSELFRSLTGWDINKTSFRSTDWNINIRKAFVSEKLIENKDGFIQILAEGIDRENIYQLVHILKVTHIYTIGFKHQENIYGGFLIITRKAIEKDDIEIIESISTRISMSIHRRMIENDLRISENRIKKLNKSLEGKVKERTTELELANQKMFKELSDRIVAEETLKMKETQLKELNATKDKFFNIIAHDLKNPFTSILGSSELLFQNIHMMDNEKIKKLATILNDSAKSGYAILQNLLDWSRSQTGLLQFNPERICLSDLIDENITYLQLLALNKEISLFSEAEKNIEIFTDAKMTNTILRNLLTNSIKFTRRGGKVTVSTSTDAGEVIISVKDSGIGIPKEQIDKLFRIDVKNSLPGTENEQGTGLGLKLCKEFAEKLGGRIWVESIENKGSEFKFTIPVHADSFHRF